MSFSTAEKKSLDRLRTKVYSTVDCADEGVRQEFTIGLSTDGLSDHADRFPLGVPGEYLCRQVPMIIIDGDDAYTMTIVLNEETGQHEAYFAHLHRDGQRVVSHVYPLIPID